MREALFGGRRPVSSVGYLERYLPLRAPSINNDPGDLSVRGAGPKDAAGRGNGTVNGDRPAELVAARELHYCLSTLQPVVQRRRKQDTQHPPLSPSRDLRGSARDPKKDH